jgi:hypothetical protein
MQGKQVEVFKAHIKTGQMYEYYARTHFKTLMNKNWKVHKDSEFYMRRTMYSDILREFNTAIADCLLYEAFEFILPCNLGKISIRKKKPEVTVDDNGNIINRLPVDRKATHELWEEDPQAKADKKYIYHLNEHSNGYIATFYYRKKNAKFVGKGRYNVRPTRTIKRTLNKIMTSDFNQYDYFLVPENNF